MKASNKCKAYTSLEQSKKLAEFLPLESADMHYHYDFDFDELESIPTITEEDDHFVLFPKDVRCWSLASLLNVIPKEVKIKGQRYAPCLFPIIDGHWLYRLWYNSNEIIESPIGVWCDNPIDACYEMIVKLHEQKLL